MSNAIVFKQSPRQFMVAWERDQQFRATGRLVAYSIIGLSMAMVLFHIVVSVQDMQLPFITLMDGGAISRLVWLTLLSDLGAGYVLSEITRREHLTSMDDVFGFMDIPTKQIMVQSLRLVDRERVQLTPDLYVRIILETKYMQNVLGRLELNSQAMGSALEKLPQPVPVPASDRFQIEARLQQYLQDSANHAVSRKSMSYGMADVFMTLLEKEPELKQYFEQLDVTLERLSGIIQWLSNRDQMYHEYLSLRQTRMHTGPKNQAWTSVPTPHLDHYVTDMTIQAASGAIPLISVREKEIEAAISILSRVNKNSLLLVGETGAGKSTVVERIALKMLGQAVPLPLQDKRLLHLDAAALHADPGGFGVAFEEVVQEGERAGNVILFLSDLQDLASEKSGGLAAIELLLPILERGRMQVIGATSVKDYHLHIEPSGSVASAFGVLEVPEMNEADAITVLEESALQFEARHRVVVSLKAIEAAVHLSAQYIHDRVLPEKAIDLVDEACVTVSRSGRSEVTEADVRVVIAEHTHVPVGAMGQNEQKLLLDLESELHKRVIGQDEAVGAVAEALRRSRAGLGDTKRPIGVFLFVGPTGVGKTELAKALASVYFKSEEAMVRLDMSEYRDSAAISKLIGTDGREGLLTAPVRTHPFTLILLDEFEKAAGEVRNLFLQVFDDGRLTDGAGQLIDFKNSIIIATSNAGSLEIQQTVQAGGSYDQLKQMLLANVLPPLYSPELLNRFDGVVVFRSLNAAETLQIATLEINRVVARLKASTGVNLTVSAAAVETLARLGFDPTFGGRPLRRVIQDRLEGPLAKKVLAGSVKRGDNLTIDNADLVANPAVATTAP